MTDKFDVNEVKNMLFSFAGTLQKENNSDW
jgi:hypothetical protein